MTLFLAAIADSEEMELHFLVGIFFWQAEEQGNPHFVYTCLYIQVYIYIYTYIYSLLLLSILVPFVSTAMS